MKIFSEELVEKAVKELHIANLAQATIGDVLLVAQYLERKRGFLLSVWIRDLPALQPIRSGLKRRKPLWTGESDRNIRLLQECPS